MVEPSPFELSFVLKEKSPRSLSSLSPAPANTSPQQWRRNFLLLAFPKIAFRHVYVKTHLRWHVGRENLIWG
jgi:hypothetical protein